MVGLSSNLNAYSSTMSLQSQRRFLAINSSSNNKIWGRRIGNSSSSSSVSPSLAFVGIATARTTCPRYYYYSVLAHNKQRRPLFLSTATAFFTNICPKIHTDLTKSNRHHHHHLQQQQQKQQHQPQVASLFSTQATVHGAAAAAEASGSAASSTDLDAQFQTLLQQQHDEETANHLVKAQEILTLLQQQQQQQQQAVNDDKSNSTTTTTTTLNYSSDALLTQYRASLFHAWMQRQDALLTRLELMLVDEEEQEDYESSSNKNHRRISLLRQAVQAVKAAHDVLESMEPQLAPQHVVLAAIDNNNNDGGTRITTMLLNEANFLEGGEGEPKTATTITDPKATTSSSSPLSKNVININNSKDDNLDIALLGQSVLQAWARLLEAAAAAHTTPHRVGGGGGGECTSTTSSSLLHRSRAMRGIPQRAQFLLDRMVAIHLLGNSALATTTTRKSQRNNKSSSSSSLTPPQVEATECYNAVLKAWAYSQEHLRGVMAERVFQEMLQSSNNPGAATAAAVAATPNGDSYRFIIRAWSWSRDRRAAFTATGHFMKMLRHLESSHVSTRTRTSMNDGEQEDNHDLTTPSNSIVNDMEPTLQDYHVLLQAWTRAEDKMSPTKAQSVLRLMQNALENGYTTIRPDADCYLYVLQTCAQRPLLANLGHTVVNEIFQKLQNDLIIPNAAMYDATICVWKNCALHPDANEWRQDCVEKTYDLLQEMRMANQKANSTSSIGSGGGGRDGGRGGGDEGYRGITTENINHVLEALTVSSDPRRTEQAEALLKEMEDNLTAGIIDGDNKTKDMPTPNASSYRLVMNVWNSTKDREKLARAKAILWRMKDHLLQGRQLKMPRQSRRRRHGAAQVAVAPVDVLNAFVHLCASFTIENQEEGMILIREVLSAVSTLKSSGLLHPNAASYTAILQAARKLLPLGPGRQHVVEQIFKLARDDGMVNETVLQELMAVATSDQYARLVIAPSHDMEGTTRVVPEEWTRNAFGNGNSNSNKKGRVLSADGRRSHPLAVDGQMKMTKAMQDFKMRRLRDKRNRNLLRGGRWDRSQDKEVNKSGAVIE